MASCTAYCKTGLLCKNPATSGTQFCHTHGKTSKPIQPTQPIQTDSETLHPEFLSDSWPAWPYSGQLPTSLPSLTEASVPQPQRKPKSKDKDPSKAPAKAKAKAKPKVKMSLADPWAVSPSGESDSEGEGEAQETATEEESQESDTKSSLKDFPKPSFTLGTKPCDTRVGFQNRFRDHVYRTFMFIKEWNANPNSAWTQESLKLLLKNQDEIGALFSSIPGAQVQITKLFREHIMRAPAVLKSAKARDMKGYNDAMNLWKANASDIAKAIVALNPSVFSFDVSLREMYMHLDLLVKYASPIFANNPVEAHKNLEIALDHFARFGDYLTHGLTKVASPTSY